MRRISKLLAEAANKNYNATHDTHNYTDLYHHNTPTHHQAQHLTNWLKFKQSIKSQGKTWVIDLWGGHEEHEISNENLGWEDLQVINIEFDSEMEAILLFIIALLIVLIFKYLITGLRCKFQSLRFIPETCYLIGFGLVCGCLVGEVENCKNFCFSIGQILTHCQNINKRKPQG